MPETSNIPIQEGLEPYLESIQAAEARLQQARSYASVPGYLDQGAFSVVVRIQEDIVAKFPIIWKQERYYDDVTNAEEADDKAAAIINGMQRTVGIPGLEQLVGWTRSDSLVWCSAYVEGEAAKYHDASLFTPDQYWRLFDTVEHAYHLGVNLDESTDNIRYNPKDGFTIIDYIDADYEQYPPTNLSTFVAKTLAEIAAPDNIFASRLADFRPGKLPPEAVVFKGLFQERYGPARMQDFEPLWLRSVH